MTKQRLLSPPRKPKKNWMKGFSIPKTDKTIPSNRHGMHQHSALPGSKVIKSKGGSNG